MSPSLPTLSGNQLHLWPIFREALAFLWQRRYMLWKWVLVCGVLVGLADYATETFILLESEEVNDLSGLYGDDMIYTFPIVALYSLLYPVFCIRCHRLALLGPRAATDPFPPQINKREFFFVSCILIIAFGTLFAIVIIGTPISLVGFGLSNLLV